jgi:hypothetical protein
MMPMRANIAGPPVSAKDQRFRRLPFRGIVLDFGSLVMKVAASRSVTSFLPFGKSIGSSNGLDQDTAQLRKLNRNYRCSIVPSGKIRMTVFPCFLAKRTGDQVPDRICS